MHVHTGQMMNLVSEGRGAVYSGLSKYKINKNISTETELVGAIDALTQVLWTQYFIEHQGYNIKDNEFNQYNQSTILLEKNGIVSGGKLTRHINISYLFITDITNFGELRVKYCPTEETKADFLRNYYKENYLENSGTGS